jgi:hypothetical protein
MEEERAMDERVLYRWGGMAAVVGALVTLVTNLLHPRISDFDEPVSAFIEEIAGSGTWVLLHLGLVVGVLLITVGLFALGRSLKGGPAEGWARVALGSLLVSTPIVLVTLGIDGYGSKAAADAWAEASGPARQAAFATAAALVQVSWGCFMLMTITYVGLTPILFGAAVAASGEYPLAVGWAVAILGAGAVVAGVIGFGGQSALFWVLFVATSGLITLWILAMGVLLGRKSSAQVPV